jgi:hypothetical protein
MGSKRSPHSHKHYPQKRERIRWITKGNTTVILDPQRGKYYKLNRTASLIWDYCDGANDTSAMARILRSVFHSADRGELKEDVQKMISSFYKKKLISFKK